MQLIKPIILIADSQDMTRRGISLMIKMEIEDFTIIQTNSRKSIITELGQLNFTHLILDIVFPDGNALEILPDIKKLYPTLKILFFSIQPPQVNAEILKLFNTPYYLSKTADDVTVVKILKNFFTTGNNFAGISRSLEANGPFKVLTPRELQVLYYLLNGLGTKQISETLHLKMNSISTLKKRIYHKTGATNFKELIDLCNLHKIKY